MTESWAITDIVAYLAHSTSQDEQPITGSLSFFYLRRLVHNASHKSPHPSSSGPDPVLFPPDQIPSIIEAAYNTRFRTSGTVSVYNRVFLKEDILSTLITPFKEGDPDALLLQVRRYYRENRY